MPDAVDAWLARATADAASRGLEQLKPLLESLARSLRALRDADRDFAHPAIPEDDDEPAG